MLDTGFPRADAENDFLRARRHQFLAALTNRLRGRPVDSGRLVPLDEIVGSLGWRGQRQLGLTAARRLTGCPHRSYWGSICRAITLRGKCLGALTHTKPPHV